MFYAKKDMSCCNACRVSAQPVLYNEPGCQVGTLLTLLDGAIKHAGGGPDGQVVFALILSKASSDMQLP